MIHAYDESYIDHSSKVMAEMLDYAVTTLSMEADRYMQLFVISGIASQFEVGNPKYIVGMSGCELACYVLSCVYDSRNKAYSNDFYTNESHEMIKSIYSRGRTPAYWSGFVLGHYQWYCADRFSEILQDVPLSRILTMYDKYHEMDLQQFFDEMARLRHMLAYAHGLSFQRKKMGYSQRDLAVRAQVPLRTIQQYEQGQKNIRRAACETVLKLARALHCQPEEIIR